MSSEASRSTAASDEYLQDVKKKFSRAMDLAELARKDTEIDVDYYHGKQWTPSEVSVLNARKQPAIVFNRIKPAINGTIGVVERGKTDPKAWGRNPQDEDAGDVATDSLRYIADKNRFQTVRSNCFRDMLIEGICGALVEVDQSREVKITKIRPEHYFYDPYSREPDFSDARYNGLAKWMDEEDAVAFAEGLNPGSGKVIPSSLDAAMTASQTYLDRPIQGWAWADGKSRRVMVVDMYHRRGPEWLRCVFVSGGVIFSGPSEYKDSEGKTANPIYAQSAYVDRDNFRYGAVRDMRGPQDAINKSRSKRVHLLNVRQARVSRRIDDVDAVRAELAKPDGIIQGDDGEVEILNTQQYAPEFAELEREAKQEMERMGPNPGVLGRDVQGQSGRAILAQQQAGLIELAPLLGSFDDWTLRIYRACWDRIKQFWDQPMFIRVTDDENAPEYVGLNMPQPIMGPDGQPQLDQMGQPMTKMLSPANMDVDIIIDSTPDTASLQEEQFQRLTELVQAGVPIPPDALIEASSLPRKRAILDKLKAPEGPPQPSPQEIEMQGKQQAAQAQMQLDLQVAEHKSQLMAQDMQSKQSLAQQELALDTWKAQNDAQLKREQMALDYGLEQEKMAHEATLANSRMQNEAILKRDVAAAEHGLSVDRAVADLHVKMATAPEPKSPMGDGGESGEMGMKPTRRVRKVKVGLRDAMGRPNEYEITDEPGLPFNQISRAVN